MISVIIPTYNRAAVISKTIKSVLNQTYSDLEVIVVADGHQEDVQDIVKDFGDKRLKYFAVEHSGRPAVPRNFGIRKVSGQYIAFCDDDDIWMSEKLQLQIDKMNEDREIGFVYTQVLLQEREKKRIVPKKGREGFIFKELFLSCNFIANSTVLIKRATIDTVGLFDEDMRLKAAEDFDLWLRISYKHKVGFIDKPLAIHVESSDNISAGYFAKLRKYYLATSKHYRKKNVGLWLFIRSLLLSSYRIIFEIRHKQRF